MFKAKLIWTRAFYWSINANLRSIVTYVYAVRIWYQLDIVEQSRRYKNHRARDHWTRSFEVDSDRGRRRVVLRPRVSLFFNKNKYRFEVRPLHDNDPRPWPRGLYICVCVGWKRARLTGQSFPRAPFLGTARGGRSSRNGKRRKLDRASVITMTIIDRWTRSSACPRKKDA